MTLFNRRLLAYARDSRAYVALTVTFGLAGTVLVVVQAMLLAHVVVSVFESGAGLDEVAPALWGLAAAATGRAAFAWGAEVAAQVVAARATEDLRARLLARALALGPLYLSGERTGELVAAATRGVEALEVTFARYLPQIALAAMAPLVVLGWILRLDAPSALIVAATVPLVPVFMVLIGLEARRRAATQWGALAGLSAHFLDVLQGLPTLRVFGRARAQASILRRVADRYGTSTMGTLRVAFLSALVLEMLATLSTALVAVAIGLRLLDGDLRLEPALAVLVLTPEVYLPLRQLGARFHANAEGAAAAERVFEVLEARGQANARERESHARSGPAPVLAFDRVSFSYRKQAEPALRDVSFSVEAGERVALVGPSGAGKSTLLSLLLRFADPDSGRIRANGRDLASIDPDAWRRRVAWVPQRPSLFRGSVADNVRLGWPEATDEEVCAALRQANALDFVQALPGGLDAAVGERGSALSAGQRQRIALARAFVHGADLLLLDEPTANLDAESETAIADALDRLGRDTTMLLVAHVAALVRGADRVITMEAGRVGQLAVPGTSPWSAGPAAVLSSQKNAAPSGSASVYPRAPAFTRAASSRFGTDGRIDAGRERPSAFVDHSASPESIAVRPAPAEPSSGEAPWETFWRLVGLARPHWRRGALAVLLGFLTVGSTVGLMATAAFLIARASQRPSIADLSLAVVGVRFFGISRGVFRYLERLVSHGVTLRLLADLRVWAYTRLEPLAPAGLEAFRDGDLLARVVADVDALQDFFVRVLLPPLVAVLVAVVVGGLLWLLLPAAAIVLVASLMVAGLVVPWLAGALSRESSRCLAAARAELTAFLVETLQGAPDLLAFGRAEEHLVRLRALGAALGRQSVTAAAQAGLADAAGTVVAGVSVALVLAVGTPAVLSGTLDGVLLVVLALAAMASFEAVQPLPTAFQRLSLVLRAASRLFALADTRPPVRDPVEPRPLSPGPHSAALEDVSLRYAADRPLALDNASLRIEPGARVAIVGPSGAGKTTLANVLLRFREPEAGRALLDGYDAGEHAQDDVRRLVGLVDQEAHLFNVSILDNVRLARPDAPDVDVERALRGVHLWDWAQSLPDGWRTVVGEGGARVSGGQRRRLALARALVADFPILVLDEPTANLDPETAHALLRDVLSATADRSIVLITHRLDGLETMDEILVMDAGRVVERGTLAALLLAGGRFSRLWRAAHPSDGPRCTAERVLGVAGAPAHPCAPLRAAP